MKKPYDPYSPPPDDFVSEWKAFEGDPVMQAKMRIGGAPFTQTAASVRDNWHLFEWARPIEPAPDVHHADLIAQMHSALKKMNVVIEDIMPQMGRLCDQCLANLNEARMQTAAVLRMLDAPETTKQGQQT